MNCLYKTLHFQGEIYGESNMETYITIYKRESQWEFAVWLKELKQGLCNKLEGWDGVGGGRRFEREETCIPMADLCRCLAETNKFCKAIIPQINFLKPYISSSF